MSMDASLTTCLGQAPFFGEKDFGVVRYGDCLGIQVKSSDVDEILSILQSKNARNSWEQLEKLVDYRLQWAKIACKNNSDNGR